VIPLRDYILGGNATFTLVSRKTGERLTFRVRHWEDQRFTVFLRGHGERNWNYLGMINRERMFYTTKKSRFPATSPEVLGFSWLWRNADTLKQAEFLPSGKCCCCGRQLTTPYSIAKGLGPDCEQQRGRRVA
jgi:hypothetical protein